MGEFRKFPYHLFSATPVRHRGHARILIRCKVVEDGVRHISQLAGAQWDEHLKCWHLPDCKTNRKKFHLKHEYVTPAMRAAIHEINRPPLEKFVEFLEMRAYSHYTIRTYVNEFVQLLTVLKAVSVDSLTSERLKSYFKYCSLTLNLSENTMHSRMNAVKCYFEQLSDKTDIFIGIPVQKSRNYCRG